jgi:surfactin synthase thioesterase subunit
LKGADIDYVEAHGTGTSLGDPIEVRAIGATYGERDANHVLKIGSVKPNIGHLEGAAGVAGVIKTILALQHEVIPTNIHFQTLNPKIELNFPGGIVTQNMLWPRGSRVRRAGVSSFGFSGINAHLILEEGPKLSEDQQVQWQTRALNGPDFHREHYWAVAAKTGVNDLIYEWTWQEAASADDFDPKAEGYSVIKKAVSSVVADVVGLSKSKAVKSLDNFFDMGMDSLMAMELKNRLQLFVGKTAELPATLVFDYPSVESMTQGLAGILNVDYAPIAVSQTVGSNWVVQEAPIPNPSLRVFCFHHAGGSASAFKGWQKEMPPGVELDLIQLPGRQKRYKEAFISDQEMLVAAIIEAIKERLDKPYLFFAHSIGTMVASEVVQGLKRLNLPLPAHLILSGSKPLYFRSEKNQTPSVKEMDDEALLGFIVDTIGVPETAIHDLEALKLILPMFRADVTLFEKPVHLKEPLTMPITGLHAKDDKFVRADEVQLWSKVTQAGYHQLSIPGAHMSLLDDPSPYIDVIKEVILTIT